MNTRITISYLYKTRLILAICLSCMFIGCSDTEEGGIIDDSIFCQVEVNGNFEDLELDEQPMYLNGGSEGFYDALFGVIIYPAEARQKGIEGLAVVHYEITEEGRVENVIAIQDPGAGIGASAINAVSTATNGVSF